MNSGANITETRPSVPSPSGPPGPESPHGKQDTPWINVLSVVSRPAVSLLQKYLPGLLQARSLNDTIPEWVSEAQRQTLSGKEVAILRKFGENLPFMERNLQSNVGRLVVPRSESNLRWMTEELLSELGIIDGGNIENEHDQGRFSSAINRGHVLLNVPPSTDAASSLLQSDWRGANWWGGLWGSDDGSQSWLSKLALGKGEGLHAAHCSQRSGRTKAAVAQTTALFVQFSRWELMSSENAGHSSSTQQPVNNGRLECPQPESLKCSDALLLQQEPSINGSSICPGMATGFSEVAVLTPDQDNGYSSLEEGLALCQPHTIQACSTEVLQVEGSIAIEDLVNLEPTEGPSQAAEGMVEEAAEEEAYTVGGSDGRGVDMTPKENSTADSSRLTSPFCQNRAIAFIMGGPCSDNDDDSDSLSGSEYSDDGFDSEGSSDISDSDSDDSNSDDEVDSEADRLWNSLCRPQDPYNLHHFTAPIVTAPRPIPSTSAAVAATLSSDSSPDPSPDKGASPAVSLALSVSPPALQHPDSWDDSTSASEAEDADGLLNYFSSSSDPYSPWNFQAPIRSQRSTAAPAEVQQQEGRPGKSKSLETPPRSAQQAAATSSPPQYRREEAEDRLDSGFSEPPPPATVSLVTSQSCAILKKVRFCEEVEEFVTSSREEEDRRGHWEELARDRCRFSRRCRDVEQSIAYCFEPQHRTLVYQRIAAVKDPES